MPAGLREHASVEEEDVTKGRGPPEAAGAEQAMAEAGGPHAVRPRLVRELTRERGVAPREPLPPPARYVTDTRVTLAGLEGERCPDPRAHLERDPCVLPTTEERKGYRGPHHHAYWLKGLQDFLKVREAVELHGNGWESVRAILDLGCSSGRVLRHYACQNPGLEVWGADIDAGNVEWVRRHLHSRIVVFQDSMIPHLPMADASVDVVSAFSVFTHIDLFEMAWLLELRRILRPGGISYVSVHTERTWRRIADRAETLRMMQECQAATPQHRITRGLFLAPMPADRIVFRRPQATLPCNTFQTERRLRNTWGRAFEIRGIYEAALGDFQDVVLLRRPPAAPRARLGL